MFARILCVGMALVLVLAPTQWAVNLGGVAQLSLIDPLIALLALVWLADRIERRDGAFTLPPVENLALILLAIVSIGVAEDRIEAAKTVVQLVLYFGIGHIIFVDVLRIGGSRVLRTGFWLVLFSAGINLALAGIQYFGANPDPLFIRGAFSNRNAFGAYIAWLLPLCAGMVRFAPSARMRIAAATLFAAGLAFTLSGAALLSVGVALGAGLLLSGRRRAFIGMVVLAILLAHQGLPRLPRANDQALLDSMAIYELRNNQVNATYRYPEWQAAGVLILEHPWRGVGAGNYQQQINRYYGIIPNPTGPQEPDIQNLFLVLAVSLGIPGLAAFLAMLFRGLRCAVHRGGSGAGAVLRWGGGAAIAAMMINGIWTPWIVRGILPLVAALLASLHWMETQTHGDTV